MADVGFIEIHAPGFAVQVDSTNHPLTVFFTMQSTASPPHARATQLLRIRKSLIRWRKEKLTFEITKALRRCTHRFATPGVVIKQNIVKGYMDLETTIHPITADYIYDNSSQIKYVILTLKYIRCLFMALHLGYGRAMSHTIVIESPITCNIIALTFSHVKSTSTQMPFWNKKKIKPSPRDARWCRLPVSRYNNPPCSVWHQMKHQRYALLDIWVEKLPVIPLTKC